MAEAPWSDLKGFVNCRELQSSAEFCILRLIDSREPFKSLRKGVS